MADEKTCASPSDQLLASATDPNPEVPPTVLVVDDDPDLVDFLTRFLSQRGMVVLSASSGQQCLEKVRQNPTIDVVVLDVEMPGMDGLAVWAALKKTASTRSIPIILFTGDDIETRLKEMQLGVSDFVMKPASGRDLLTRIQTQLKASHRARKGSQG